MKTFLTLLALTLGVVANAQKPFTLRSELARQQKRYPHISAFEPDSANVVAIKNVPYREVGVRVLTVDIYLPKEAANAGKGKKNVAAESYPVVGIVHGGGWRSGAKDLDHPMARALAAKGYAVVCIDYRKSFEALYPAAVVDIKCAIRWARANAEKYHLDCDTFTLIGSSAGGQMAALIGTNVKLDKFNCDVCADECDDVQRVIDIDGVLGFLHPDSSEGDDRPGKPSAATLWFGGNVEEKRDLFEEASAMNHVSESSADFLFINSAQKRFSAGQAEMMEQLRAKGHKADERKTEQTPHTFWLFEPWAHQVVQWIDEWLRE